MKAEDVTLAGIFKTVAFALVAWYAIDIKETVASIGGDVQDIKTKIAVIEVNLGDVGKMKIELQETRDRLLTVESLLFGPANEQNHKLK